MLTTQAVYNIDIQIFKKKCFTLKSQRFLRKVRKELIISPLRFLRFSLHSLRDICYSTIYILFRRLNSYFLCKVL